LSDRPMSLAFLFVLMLLAPQDVRAQSSPILPQRNYEQTTPPRGTPATPEPPPIGSGSKPLPVTPGDQGAIPLPVTNTADMARTNNLFQTQQRSGITVLHVFMQTTNPATGNSRGLREVQTLRLDQLPVGQAQNILGIFGAQSSGDQQHINVTATSQQIEKLNSILFPYPQNVQQG